MITRLSVTAINSYQYYISPHKGYCCAYRAYTGEDSCSQFEKVAIQNNGLFSSFPLIKEQFKKCNFAFEEIKKEKENQKYKKSDACPDSLAGCSIFDTCGTIGSCNPFH